MPQDDKTDLTRSRTDGSVDRLRADIDRGRTGDKVDWPDPFRPTSETRSPAETDSSAPVSKGVPPKVRAISLS